MSAAGVGSFLYCHPLLSDLVYEDTVGALAAMDQFGGWEGERDCPVFSVNMLTCLAETGGVTSPGDTDSKAASVMELLTTLITLFTILNDESIDFGVFWTLSWQPGKAECVPVSHLHRAGECQELPG